MEYIAELPLKDGEFITHSEKVGEKYWLLHSQTESFVMDFETHDIKRAIKHFDEDGKPILQII